MKIKAHIKRPRHDKNEAREENPNGFTYKFVLKTPESLANKGVKNKQKHSKSAENRGIVTNYIKM